jgi:hypothetical protein
MDTPELASGSPCSDNLLDQRCLSTNCGPTSFVDYARHPSWLLDSHRTPTISLGQIAIPAPLLPLIVSVVLLYYNRGLLFHSRRDRRVEIGKLTPGSNGDSPQWPDFRHPDALRFYAAKANLVFHGIITLGAVLHFGRSFLGTNTLCCSQAAALLLYARLVKPEKRKSCLAAAAGWTLFMFLDQVPGSSAIMVAGLVVLLVLPLAWQLEGVRGDVEFQQNGSVLLLMLLVANKVVFESQAAAEEWARQHLIGADLCVAALYAFNGLMTWVSNRDDDARHRDDADWDWNLQVTQATMREILSKILESLCVLVALLGPLAGGIVCTAFLTSCLPWSGLVFGKCASPPSLSLYSVGSGFSIHIGIWIIAESIRQFRESRRAAKTPAAILRTQLRLNANVIGWSCTLLNILWVAVGILA